MGCLFSKQYDILISKQDITQYTNVYDSDIKYDYSNPIRSENNYRENVTI
jgi:hypothetical protein